MTRQPPSPPPDDSADAQSGAAPSSVFAAIVAAARREGEAAGPPGDDDAAALNHGIKAFMAGDFSEAHRLLLPLAKAGYGRAQSLLSRMYYAGNGVPRDHAKYVYWLGRAAAGGDRTAKAKLKRLAKATRPSDEGPQR